MAYASYTLGLRQRVNAGDRFYTAHLVGEMQAFSAVDESDHGAKVR